MLVRDQMSRPAITVEPGRSVAEARDVLRRRQIRQLPVVERGNLVGIVTDRDLRAATRGTRNVGAIMTSEPLSVDGDETLDQAAHLLRTRKINALPVIEDGEVVGVLTTSDVIDAFIRLSGVAEPTYRVSLIEVSGRGAESRVRAIAERCHAEVKWIHPSAQRRMHVRVKIANVGDFTTALEAEGFQVALVVASTPSIGDQPHTALR